MEAYQNTTDERDLEGSGQDMEDHGREQEADALGTAVNSTRQTSRLARQMEAQAELQQMLVHAAGNLANGFLGHTGEDGITKFLEEGRADAGYAVYSGSHSRRL